MSNTEKPALNNEVSSRTDELQTFLLLTVVLAPILAVVCVGGYGFVIWMSQLIFGPPGA